MEIKLPDTSNFSKSKTTFLSVIGLIMGAWAAESYSTGALVNLDWPIVTVIGLMVLGRCVHIVFGKK